MSPDCRTPHFGAGSCGRGGHLNLLPPNQCKGLRLAKWVVLGGRCTGRIYLCVYILYFYLAACGPKGHGSGLPLPPRTAALFRPLIHGHILSPATVSYTGAALSPTPVARQTEEGLSNGRKKGQGKVHPRAGRARPPRSPVPGPRLPPCPRLT